MKTLIFLLSLGCAVFAFAQTPAVQLRGWRNLENNRAVEPTASMPAGAQWVHAMPDGDFQLKFIAQFPVTETPDSWPVVEVGAVAIVFGGGRAGIEVFLAVGDNPPQPVSGKHALSDGGSVPVVLTVVREGGRLTIKVGDTETRVDMPVSPQRQVVLSAGADAAIELKELRVLTVLETETGSREALGTGARSAAENGTAGSVTPKRSRFWDDIPPAGEAAAGSATGEKKRSAKVTFEIFTPAPFRGCRADDARKAVNELKR